MEESDEVEDNGGESIEKVPQTPLVESATSMQRCVHEFEVPDEEGLVEAQITWEIGKALGCLASNEKAVIEAIAKVP